MQNKEVVSYSSILEAEVRDSFKKKALSYFNNLETYIEQINLDTCYTLACELYAAWSSGNRVFICGNGGSAANAMHIANDFHYGVGASLGKNKAGKGLRIEALTSNSSILTCLANDIGYEEIFSHQLNINASENDILIVLSGSGNSKNIVNALQVANSKSLKTYAILGFDGGECIKIANESIHVSTYDMQIAEDLQLIIGHILMQWLNQYESTIHS